MVRIVSPPWVYGFSFSPPTKGQKESKPALVLTVSQDTAEKLESVLNEVDVAHRVGAQEYLRSDEPFVTPRQQYGFSWAPEMRFGFGERATKRRVGEEIEYRVILTDDRPQLSALSLNVLFMGLNSILATTTREEQHAPAVNRIQLFEVFTLCATRMHHAHAIGGEVYPISRRWLSRLAAEGSETQRRKMEACVLKAMRTAWHAVAPAKIGLSREGEDSGLKKYSSECRCGLSKSGRFSFQVFGNACDASMYPDQDNGPDANVSSGFSSHNLDSSFQQLTLLAGVAALHMCAAKELD